MRNWDNQMRNSQQEADGIVGEVVFPNTVPPFFPSFVLFAPPPAPEDYEHRLAGIRTHNRWLKDWCDEFPGRRAGVGQIFLNDIDDAIEDATWIKEDGLRGGVLLPTVAPDVTWVKPLYHPDYDRLWAALQDLDIPVNLHGGTGAPDYGKFPAAPLMYINEAGFYSQRPLVQFIVSGVFDRFPKLKMAITETGCFWVPPLLKQLDQLLGRIRKTGRTGELAYDTGTVPQLSATEYFQRNCWISFEPVETSLQVLADFIGPNKILWATDYPHPDGFFPGAPDMVRQRLKGTSPEPHRGVLAGGAMGFYGLN